MNMSRDPLKSIENQKMGDHGTSLTGVKDTKKEFNNYVRQARAFEAEHDVLKAISCYEKAKILRPNHEKLDKKIDALKASLRVLESAERLENGWFRNEHGEYLLDPTSKHPYYLPANIYEKLYGYQKEGVRWMWSLFKQKMGGVLGDDMGLGKTVQVSAFLKGLMHSEFVERILLILPLSLMANWENELKKWCGNVRIVYFHGAKSTRERNLAQVLDRSGIVLTTYGTVQTNYDVLCEYEGETIDWDVIILDEGHHIKNPSKKTTKAVKSLSATTKIVLTGTPIMNNLTELWSLYDFCCDGKLLDDLQTFKGCYETTISEGNMKNATEDERKRGYIMANRLRDKIGPFFLRREKQEVLNNPNTQTRSPKPMLKSKKEDYICWIKMTDDQRSLYKQFLTNEGESIDDQLMTKKTPFDAILTLKNICLHPALIKKEEHISTLNLQSIDPLEDKFQYSSKLGFLSHLLKQLKRDGHRVLIFSQRVEMLNIIEDMLREASYVHRRIDGSISDTQERQQIVDEYNNDHEIFVLLLTTKVGGVGLNLTSADRVVIFDPSWNMATDDQAVDRAYRIGQKKDVVIYRLMTCGSIEEKMYRRQIFKGSLSQTMTAKSQQQFGYFSKGELVELFKFDEQEAHVSVTHRILRQLHPENGMVKGWISQELLDIEGLYGVSDHSLLFHEESSIKLKEISESALKEGFESMFEKYARSIGSVKKSKKHVSRKDELLASFNSLSIKTKKYSPEEYMEKKRREEKNKEENRMNHSSSVGTPKNGLYNLVKKLDLLNIEDTPPKVNKKLDNGLKKNRHEVYLPVVKVTKQKRTIIEEEEDCVIVENNEKEERRESLLSELSEMEEEEERKEIEKRKERKEREDEDDDHDEQQDDDHEGDDHDEQQDDEHQDDEQHLDNISEAEEDLDISSRPDEPVLTDEESIGQSVDHTSFISENEDDEEDQDSDMDDSFISEHDDVLDDVQDDVLDDLNVIEKDLIDEEDHDEELKDDNEEDDHISNASSSLSSDYHSALSELDQIKERYSEEEEEEKGEKEIKRKDRIEKEDKEEDQEVLDVEDEDILDSDHTPDHISDDASDQDILDVEDEDILDSDHTSDHASDNISDDASSYSSDSDVSDDDSVTSFDGEIDEKRFLLQKILNQETVDYTEEPKEPTKQKEVLSFKEMKKRRNVIYESDEE